MKISDIIYCCDTHSGLHRPPVLCRVRIFLNKVDQVVAVITDLGSKNMGGSVTNNIECICESLIGKGYTPSETVFIEHYETNNFGQATFDKVSVEKGKETTWESVSESDVVMLTQSIPGEFINSSLSDLRILDEVEKLRVVIDPLIDFPYQQSSAIINRRFEIETNKISKQSLIDLVNRGAGETELQMFLEKDMSILGELYAGTSDDYICFSTLSLNGGFVDFAVFTGISRMVIVLIEIKGADFYLFNEGHYDKFNAKMDGALHQIRERLGFIHRNMEIFRKQMHQLRENVEAGKNVPNSFKGPCEGLQVDRNKDVYIHCVVIGGRTRDDLSESKKRHDYEDNFKIPIKVESWDTLIRKIRRL